MPQNKYKKNLVKNRYLYNKKLFKILFYFAFVECTLMVQNIITHGTAQDLVDETQEPKPEISTSVSAPVSVTLVHRFFNNWEILSFITTLS